jgi:hypothetical protein
MLTLQEARRNQAIKEALAESQAPAEERRRRRLSRLINNHLFEIKRWTPEQKREFLIMLGAITDDGTLTEAFGGNPQFGGLGK